MSISVQWMLAIEARPSDRNVSAQAYPFSTGSGATPKEVKNTGCLRIQYPLLPQPAHVLLPFYLFNCQITTMNIHPCLHNSVTQSWPHEPQHVRPPCPSPMAWSLPKPMSTESVMPSNHLILCCPLFSCPQPFQASGSFQMSQLFASGGQSIGVSASASIFPVNIQGWFPLGWTGWISLQSEGLSRVFSNTTVQKHQFFGTHLSLESNSHIHT